MMWKKMMLAALLGVAPIATVRAEPRESCSPTSGLCWPILQLGSRGEKVRTLQILLRSRGLSVAPDGGFGPSTRNAVRLLQKKKRLRVDGLVGHQTWSEVVPQLQRGSRGESVRRLQALLNASDKRWNGGRAQVQVDGFYGARTQEAVRKLNEAISFDAPPPGTGSPEANEATWCVLLGGHFGGE